ncbi:MAG: Hsp70 family protein [Methylocella sp.]
MAHPKFSIGIDLGTSNSVLAFSPLSGEGGSEVLAIPQWDTPSTVTESGTLPSFLYLPEEAIAAQIRGRGPGSGAWVVGRLAQRKASERPGRVAQSAKSWLCHHAADRSAPFLPWGSDALVQQEKISPIDASALILAHLRAAWNARFAGQGPDFAFDAQDITITVPASFDAAAQRLTLAAAQQAGFPDHVRLLEEPQAAFYWWLEQQAGHNDPWRALPNPQTAARHILVIDIGGGTSDFSLFELSRHEGSRDPGIKRVAKRGDPFRKAIEPLPVRDEHARLHLRQQRAHRVSSVAKSLSATSASLPVCARMSGDFLRSCTRPVRPGADRDALTDAGRCLAGYPPAALSARLGHRGSCGDRWRG